MREETRLSVHSRCAVPRTGTAPDPSFMYGFGLWVICGDDVKNNSGNKFSRWIPYFSSGITSLSLGFYKVELAGRGKKFCSSKNGAMLLLSGSSLYASSYILRLLIGSISCLIHFLVRCNTCVTTDCHGDVGHWVVIPEKLACFHTI